MFQAMQLCGRQTQGQIKYHKFVNQILFFFCFISVILLLKGNYAEIKATFSNILCNIWSRKIIGGLDLLMYTKKAIDFINDMKCIQVKKRLVCQDILKRSIPQLSIPRIFFWDPFSKKCYVPKHSVSLSVSTSLQTKRPIDTTNIWDQIKQVTFLKLTTEPPCWSGNFSPILVPKLI